MTDTNSRACIMKIASGPMSGHELVLTADAHLIVIDPNIQYRAEVDDNGFTTYYIPSAAEHYELAVVTEQDPTNSSDNIQEKIFSLNINDGIKSFTIPIVYQELMLADIFPIAFKALDMPWKLTDIEESIPHSAFCDDKKNNLTSLTEKRKTIFICTFLLFISFVGIYLYPTNNSEKKINMLENILQDSHYPIIATRDGQGDALILVQTQRDADWSVQRLNKENYADKYHIKKINDLESEIENHIYDYIPNLLKVDLSNPCQPVIRIIKEQALSKDRKIIDNIIKSHLACYTDSKVIEIESKALIQIAELGLTESNVPWKKINKDNHVIFIIQGNLNDKQTSSIVHLAERFSHKWGNKYIQFSVSLATNQLAGKSFIRNDQGFIILGHNHWSFNSNTLN
ncbi:MULTISPECIES: PrgH/EprH family type III secretion apparatus protein [unclassified Providencia]|uniref:PrgH/EprH family type III secretion apparatus protein n=1 Tax=unclassified Providencia TaxID=2633465 RepID=UPI0023491778|nr:MULTISPECIES: PrgH/EprH family type III secretion apparatus protein [unclassified Providencia]